MNKIETLTTDQEAMLSVYRDKWLKIGLSIDPLDFEKAKAAAKKCYSSAELEEPKYFYKFKSPLSAAVGAYILINKGDRLIILFLAIYLDKQTA